MSGTETKELCYIVLPTFLVISGKSNVCFGSGVTCLATPDGIAAQKSPSFHASLTALTAVYSPPVDMQNCRSCGFFCVLGYLMVKARRICSPSERCLLPALHRAETTYCPVASLWLGIFVSIAWHTSKSRWLPGRVTSDSRLPAAPPVSLLAHFLITPGSHGRGANAR